MAKHDGVFTGETRTVTNPAPDSISGHAGPHDRPTPTSYGKLPGRGLLSSGRSAPSSELDRNRPDPAGGDDVSITPSTVSR